MIDLLSAAGLLLATLVPQGSPKPAAGSRKGRFSLEATATDAASAQALAKLALERFDR